MHKYMDDAATAHENMQALAQVGYTPDEQERYGCLYVMYMRTDRTLPSAALIREWYDDTNTDLQVLAMAADDARADAAMLEMEVYH